jgi:hypothetical protein
MTSIKSSMNAAIAAIIVAMNARNSMITCPVLSCRRRMESIVRSLTGTACNWATGIATAPCCGHSERRRERAF